MTLQVKQLELHQLHEQLSSTERQLEITTQVDNHNTAYR